MTERASTARRRPIHLAVFLGLTTGAYATALAGVTGLQASTERAAAGARDPVAGSIDRIGARSDRLERDLAAATDAYALAAGRYGELADRLARLEAQLEGLGSQVAATTGSANALPARVALPTVSRTAPAVTRVVVHATTGASGAP